MTQLYIVPVGDAHRHFETSDILIADVETIRTVLREGIKVKMKDWKSCTDSVDTHEYIGYNKAIDDILALIDQTLSPNTDN